MVLSGSSPRIRGALRLHHPPRLVLRIIPADAGSTTFASPIGKEPQDHPRRCGEHAAVPYTTDKAAQSSSKMRGALSRTRGSGSLPAIIPADAGSTYHEQTVRVSGRDHPRRCGEHQIAPQAAKAGIGSSTQMRGAQTIHSTRPYIDGIIPANAESTGCPEQTRFHKWDHPRRCGEHTSYDLVGKKTVGSSPQMRGARG